MDEKDNKEEPQVQGPEAAEDAEDDAPLQGSALSVAHELLPISLESEMKRSYLDYAMSVIVGRALPDVRDGLKPVHRRVLHAMNEIKNTHNNPTKKAARVVGEVLGKYHPHGDSAAYMTIVRMAQPFSLRYPLIFGQGNFGSIDGDSPAAMRYTEVRLEKIAGEMLADINEDTVDFVPNFDNSEREPVVLPTRLPQLLINGSSGIAVGMATNIPPHNLREIVNGMVALMDDPEIDLAGLMEYVKGPDFPTGGIIMGRSGIRAAYATGRGKITLRGRAEIIEKKNGRYEILISEIPYMVNKTRLIESIADLVKDKRIEGISDIHDYSSRSGMHIDITLKRDANPQVVLNQLYTYTQLQSTFGVIMLALVNGEPKILTLKQILQQYIDYQCEIVTRRTRYDLKKAQERAHILEGLLTALDFIDEVIAILRASKSIPEGREALMNRFGLDEIQAQAIVQMRLGQLTGLERIKVEDEMAQLKAKIADFIDILSNESRILTIVREETGAIAEKFGDDRRTLIEEASVVQAEQHVVDEPVTVVLSQKGFLRTRQGHGHDCTLLSYKVGDGFERAVECRTVDDISFVTDTGRVYTCKVSAIPGGRGDGLPVTSFFDLDKGMKRFVGVFAGREKEDVVLGTSDGLGLKCTIGDLKASQRIGRTFVRMADGVTLMPPAEGCAEMPLIACLTEKGRLVIFAHDEIRRLSNGGMGVSLVKLESGERMIGMTLVDERGLTASGTGRGGKPREVQITRKSFEEFRMQRARKGRQIGVTWTVESIAPITPVKPENEGEGSSGAGSAGGLTIQLEDENPRLI